MSKIKSKVTGENVETFYDYDTVTARDKKVVEEVLRQLSDLEEKKVPSVTIKEKIKQDFKIEEVSMVSIEESIFWKFAKDYKLGVNIQGWRNTTIDNKPAKMPMIVLSADLDYLNMFVENILTEASNLKTILETKKDK